MRFDFGFDALAKLQIEQASKEAFARHVCVESQRIRFCFASIVRTVFDGRASRAKRQVGNIQPPQKGARELSFKVKLLAEFKNSWPSLALLCAHKRSTRDANDSHSQNNENVIFDFLQFG